MKPFAECTFVELVQFADTLGLDIPESTTSQGIIDLIELTYPELKGIDVTDAAAEPLLRQTAGAGISLGGGLSHRDAPKVRLVVHRQDFEGGELPVQVAFNGTPFVIQRDMEIDVPWPVWNILNEAVETKYRTIHTKGVTEPPELVPSNVRAYPFTVLVMPPKDAVDAWLASVADQFAP